ncbi:hypothetical protein BDY24DRAFT_416406 [Mrakia frigida]|uniref:uncharacterized protein n=1 Tax=Mrakia frigida TaxID=29902 RepID=UPI003FCC1BAF
MSSSKGLRTLTYRQITCSLAPPKKKKKTTAPAPILPIDTSAEAGPSTKKGKGKVSNSILPATTSKPKMPRSSKSKSKLDQTRLVVVGSSGSSRGKEAMEEEEE